MNELAGFLKRSGKVPGVQLYDPGKGPGDMASSWGTIHMPRPGQSITIWLPEIDKLEDAGNEQTSEVPSGQGTGPGADELAGV